ncbi:MAG: proteasome accessory factor PafA2 family protein [Armatimonadetes bacterium]|nr:proteasome accessory factor PafA2 family protein [Armatimonadota bacterium]
MRPILAGIETEYGLEVEGQGAEDQIENAKALVRSFPGKRFSGWDYTYESPRADLRGFQVGQLAIDPQDAAFDVGKDHGPSADVRADQVLPNGARFYNDHGHPEWSSPECWTLKELVLQDLAGEQAAIQAARAYGEASGREVRLYKNNTDFHGASFGCHESYLVPRRHRFEDLYAAVMPVLLARTLLCGAGKVGSESGGKCDFQLSQRADFMSVDASVDTLFCRPVFNTRDEPHADAAQWQRLHVISGDANMMPTCTARKVCLVKLALWLLDLGEAPQWKIRNPARAFQEVSRDLTGACRIELEGGSWTTAIEILESLFAAFERFYLVGHDARTVWSEEAAPIVSESRKLLDALQSDQTQLVRSVDWAAKKAMLEEYMEVERLTWKSRDLRAYDLAYHLLDSDEGLYFALLQMGRVDPRPSHESVLERLERCHEPSRAFVRGQAVTAFPEELRGISWGALSFEMQDGSREAVTLSPGRSYSWDLKDCSDVKSFIDALKEQP